MIIDCFSSAADEEDTTYRRASYASHVLAAYTGRTPRSNGGNLKTAQPRVNSPPARPMDTVERTEIAALQESPSFLPSPPPSAQDAPPRNPGALESTADFSALLPALKARVEEDLLRAERLSDRSRALLSHTPNLVRFLTGKHGNVNRTVKALRWWIKWREEFHGVGVENISEESILNELLIGKGFFRGCDKVGRPLAYVFPKLHIAREADRAELERVVVYWMEIAQAALLIPNDHAIPDSISNSFGYQVFRGGIDSSSLSQSELQTTVAVFDLEGLSLYYNMDYEFIKILFDIVAKYYPERLGQAYIINAPFMFSTSWTVISSILPSEIMEKIVFLSDPSELKDFIDEEHLLARYGGCDEYEYVFKPTQEEARAELQRRRLSHTLAAGSTSGWLW